MEVNDDGILRFWQWFVKNESIIKECIENEHSAHREYVVEQMNERVLNLGVFTWDVGLNNDERWFLMISPNGSKEMLEVSQKIMEDAPYHMNWLFYASRPPKDWDRKFTIYDHDMDEQFIDASDWNYIIFEEDDGTFELVLEAKNISHLDSEVAHTAADQFVTQEVGEEVVIRHISTVSIVTEIEVEYASSKSVVSELKEHLDEMI